MKSLAEMNSRRFSGKVALVTGSAAGIGAAIGERLAYEGASVVLTGRRAELLESRAAALRDEGLDALALAGDITTDAEATTTAHPLRSSGRAGSECRRFCGQDDRRDDASAMASGDGGQSGCCV